MQFFKKPVEFNKPKEIKNGCKIKVKRDENGKIKEYIDNGQCSPQQLKNFTENINPENLED